MATQKRVVALKNVWIQAVWTGGETLIVVSEEMTAPIQNGGTYHYLREGDDLDFANTLSNQDAFEYMATTWPQYFKVVEVEEPPNLSAG